MHFLLILVTILCFNESSNFVTENEGPYVAIPILTNTSSTDIIITIVTNNESASGEVKSLLVLNVWMCIHIIIAMY